MGICATLMAPFSGSSAAPETHLFTPSVSSYALRFPFFGKFSIFWSISLRFWQNFRSEHTNFGKKFVSKPLVFKEKFHSVTLLLLLKTRAAHIHQQKKKQ